jgi:hypothetical protein
MEKTIIILDGKAEGKTRFIEIAKNNQYWVWNFNFRNLLSMIAHKIGWNGERDNNYYAFIADFISLSNQYYNSEYWYIDTMIDKFLADDKANVAIIHNCNEELFIKLQDEFNCYSIIITENDDIDENYCKTLNLHDENYELQVLNILKTITKDFSKQNEEG